MNADDIRIKRTAEFIGSDGRILDIGTKNGKLLEAVGGIEKIAIDINPDYVAEAIKRKNVTGQVASVYKMPFDDGIFDCVILTEVLEHLDMPNEAIREISRITRGRLILSTPNNCWARKIKHKLLGKPGLISPDHLKEYSWKEVKNMVEKHGFKLKRFTGLGFFLTWKPYPLWEPLGTLFPRLSADMLMEFEKV